MKLSEAEAEVRDLLDQLAGDTNIERLVAESMHEAMGACHVKKSRRPHVSLVLQHFWTSLKRHASHVPGSPDE